jgi:hypothetical protein
MAITQRKVGPISPYCILGLKAGVSPQEVETKFRKLLKNLEAAAFLRSPQAWCQAGVASLEIENAYERIKTNDSDEEEEPVEPFWPKLGQMVVTAGKISLEELWNLLKEQKPAGKQIGQLMVEREISTAEELEAFLSSQKPIRFADDTPYYEARRLLGLGIVPEDMVGAALIEQCKSRKPVGDILVGHGWLSKEILKALDS